VRGAFDRRQVRQPSPGRLHHPPVVVQDRPRLGLVPGHYHPLHMHATTPLPCATSVTCATAQEITTSTTGNPARYEALSNIEDTSVEAGDNRRRRGGPGGLPPRGSRPPPDGRLPRGVPAGALPGGRWEPQAWQMPS